MSRAQSPTSSILLHAGLFVFVAAVAANGATAGAGVDTVSPLGQINVGYIFESYTPYALQRFFEFSDRGWNISAPCLRDMYAYLQALRHGLPWAVRLYDASAYYAGGVYERSSGMSVRLQNYRLCHQLHNSQLLNITPPFPLQLLIADYELQLAGESDKGLVLVRQQLCLPHSCRSDEELNSILEPVAYERNHVLIGQRLLQQRRITNDFRPWRSMHLHICLVYVSVACGYYALLELLLHFQQKDSERDNPPVQLATLTHSLANLWRRKFLLHSLKLLRLTPQLQSDIGQTKKAPSLHYRQWILHSSLKQTTQRLFSRVDNGTQSLILFAWTLLWMGSQLAAQLGASSLPTDAEPIGYMLDIYFLIYGCKLAQEFLRMLPTQPLELSAQLAHLATMLAQRLVCWAPLYACCMHLGALLDLHLQRNVLLTPASLDHLNCVRQSVWQLLYADCYRALTERCMPWIWPLGLELQLHAAACLLLMLASVQPRFAALIGGALYALSLLAATLWQWQSRGVSLHPTSLEQQLARHNLVLSNVFLRIAAYILGLCLGNLLWRCGQLSVPINGFLMASGWLAAGLVACFALFGYRQLLPLLTPLLTAACTAGAHTYLSLLLLWLLLIWRKVSLPGFVHAAARLTPVCVLLGPLIIRFFMFAPGTRLAAGAIDANITQLLLLCLGLCCFLYIAAATLYLLLTAPLFSLVEQLSILHEPQQQQQQKPLEI